MNANLKPGMTITITDAAPVSRQFVGGMIAYGSLCTGYDGIGIGLIMAGVPISLRFTAENEKSVASLLAETHPSVPNFGDIKTVDWAHVPRVQILSSGDPCQSISVAGRKEGRDDPRFLWPWVRDAYRALRPEEIFLENVANIASHDGGRTLAERLTNLREDGYAVRWAIMGACVVGAPHHRHRWYAMAKRVGTGAPEPVRVGAKALCGAPRTGGRILLPSPAARDGGGRGEGTPEFWRKRWAERPDRVGKGIPLGAVVNLLPTPTTADGSGGPGASGRDGGLNLRTAVQLLPTPRATDGPNQRGSVGDLTMGSACQPEQWGRFAEAVALWEGVSGNAAPNPTVSAPRGGVRLNPELPEWMMGLPRGFLTARMERNDALRAAGNGVVPLAIPAARKLLDEF